MEKVEVVMSRHWRQVRARIDGYVTEGELAYITPLAADRGVMFNDRTQNWPRPEGQFGGSYYFENSYDFLDVAGEWFLDVDADTVYYKRFEDQDMDEAVIVAPSPELEQLVAINGAERLTFRGLTFQHATWLGPDVAGLFHNQGGKYTEQRNDKYVYSPTPGGIQVARSRNIVFHRNVLRHMGANGMNFDAGTKDCLVRGNVFFEMSASGINYATNDNNDVSEDRYNENDVFENNYIFRMGRDYTAGSGIFAHYAKGLRIRRNEIEEVPNIGINVGWGASQEARSGYEDVEIVQNKIHKVCELANDCGGIHTKSNVRKGLIAENWIQDVVVKAGWRTGANDSPVSGIYLDDGSDFFTVRSNVVERVGTYVWGAPPARESLTPEAARAILDEGTPGLDIKIRNGNIGANIAIENNQAQKVLGKEKITAVGSPIDAEAASRVTERAGLSAKYQGIKAYLDGVSPGL
jgi:hypothetical protein